MTAPGLLCLSIQANHPNCLLRRSSSSGMLLWGAVLSPSTVLGEHVETILATTPAIAASYLESVCSGCGDQQVTAVAAFVWPPFWPRCRTMATKDPRFVDQASGLHRFALNALMYSKPSIITPPPPLFLLLHHPVLFPSLAPRIGKQQGPIWSTTEPKMETVTCRAPFAPASRVSMLTKHRTTLLR